MRLHPARIGPTSFSPAVLDYGCGVKILIYGVQLFAIQSAKRRAGHRIGPRYFKTRIETTCLDGMDALVLHLSKLNVCKHRTLRNFGFMFHSPRLPITCPPLQKE
jgi:hypothetical protein